MSHQPLPTYLRSHRRKWALTQRDLAVLLGDVSASTVSKYETLARTPSPEAMFALEVVFKVPASALFPALSRAARRAVLRNAAALEDRLAERHDARSVRVRLLLTDILTHSPQNHEPHS